MADRPANAGSDSAGPDSAYKREPPGAAAPAPVHHQGLPRPQDPAGYRPQHRTRHRPGARLAGRARPAATVEASEAEVHVLAWLTYLIVLAGAAIGLYIIWQGARYAALGTGLVGCALLAAAAARLLPPRYTGLLSSRSKAPDAAGFAVFGAAVLAIALLLPLEKRNPRQPWPRSR